MTTVTAPPTTVPQWVANLDTADVLDVDVTQDDLDHGLRMQPYACMIARALRRQGHSFVWVGLYIEIDHQARYAIAATVKQRIAAWDSGLPIEPFRFQTRRIEQAQGNLTTHAASPP